MAEASHTYDSLVNGEEFVSEHFFTTAATSGSFQAAVLKLRKQWDAEEGRSLRDRFLEGRAAWENQLSSLFSEADEPPSTDATAALAAETRTRLGYPADSTTWTTSRTGTELAVPGIVRRGDLLLMEATPVATVDDLFDASSRPLGEVLQDGAPFTRNVPKLVSEIFAAEDHPAWVMVLAGPWVLLTERARWAEGRYLAVNLQLAVQRAHVRKGGELDRVLAILGCDSLLPEADGTLWWDQVLTDSAEHAVGVSKELREGIRSSIEIIANDVLERRDCQGFPLEEVDPEMLARQCLRYLYRILFLLFAEARPEMGLVPSRADEYEEGYGLARLRELVLVEMTSKNTQDGTHLYESLAVLFHLVATGHQPPHSTDRNPSLRFDAIEADLFSPAATKLIDEVKLSNHAAQRVLQNLLLTRAGSGDRGFISYAELGVNQLGAVYEGLMSYSGSLAAEDLVEVAPGGDTSKGSWTVPASRANNLALNPADFVMERDELTGERRTRVHPQGSFVYRLEGRARQQSASYYTPEVLTRFVVSQALEELLDQDGKRTSATEILQLTVCEPALGSGAFAIEAVRQLAAAYLERRQEELDQQIPAEQMPSELAKVKAHIALHQVYGVDLNATAVELTEVSLWLDTMVPGLNAPWFGLRLRRGNSLIGAQRAIFRRDQVAAKEKPYLSDQPTTRSLAEDRDGLNGGIFHFLLPHEGWGSAAEANKSARDLSPEAVTALKAWRKQVRSRLTSSPRAVEWSKMKQVELLQDLSQRIEILWDFVLQRLELAEREAQRDLDFFGSPLAPTGNGVGRAEIERKLADENGAYRRLRRIMDAWCALWFWPLTETDIRPPSIDEWIDALTRLLGRTAKEQDYLHPHGSPWEQLNHREDLDLHLNGAESVGKVLDVHPWLKVTERIAAEQGFFHWELDYATVFRRGGFDLQVGNPPWVRPQTTETTLLAEFDPRWALERNLPKALVEERRLQSLGAPSARNFYLDEHTNTEAAINFYGSKTSFPLVRDSSADLYRCFIERCWTNSSEHAVVALLHPDGHVSDQKSGKLRHRCYSRLRRYWQFSNQTGLFPDIGNTRRFSVNLYGSPGEVDFMMASSLFHPATVLRSLVHDGSGPEPAVKTLDGKWDTRPHASRIIRVSNETILGWARIAGVSDSDFRQSAMSFAATSTLSNMMNRLSKAPRLRDLKLVPSKGWAETADQNRRIFHKQAATPERWSQVILQGPHIGHSTPIFKQPNPTLKNHRDWSALDMESLQASFIPRTSFQYDQTGLAQLALTESRKSRASLGSESEGVHTLAGDPISCYRLAWRDRIDNNSVRGIFPAIIPPGARHVESINSATSELGERATVYAAAISSTLIADFWLQSSNSSHAPLSLLETVPIPRGNNPIAQEMIERAILLNALTSTYDRISSIILEAAWDPSLPARLPRQRRQLQVEIDALFALAVGVSADELCALYVSNFPVLMKYDRSEYFDSDGRLVPAEIVKLAQKRGEETGERLSVEERTWVHPQSQVSYVAVPPFRQLDRERDMRDAYAKFAPLMKEPGDE